MHIALLCFVFQRFHTIHSGRIRPQLKRNERKCARGLVLSNSAKLPAGLFYRLACALGCSPETEPESESVRPVKTIVVTAGEDTRLRSFPGTVEASRRVELAFRVPGLLAVLPVKEGQNVEKGDLIAAVASGRI